MRRWRIRRSGQFLIVYRSKACEEGLVREMGDFFKAPSINGVAIPYDAGISELKKGLDAPMGDYVVCLRALAWKGDSRSFSILKGELRNKDYYRRRAALENISYHRLWETSPDLVRELLLDHNEYVVRLAAKLLNQYPDCDVISEAVIAYDFWEKDIEIRKACHAYLEKRGVDYQALLWEYHNKIQKISEDNSFYKDCSQKKLVGNWDEKEKMAEYFSVICQYFPEYSLEDARSVLAGLSEEGCGYAALIGTVMHYFDRCSYDFAHTFGFSMYDGRAESNADILLLHFYCMTDEDGFGMTVGQMISRFRVFTRAYGLKVKIDVLLKLTQNLMKEKDSYIIIMAEKFILLDDRRKKFYINEWHYMNLRDMDEEGNFMVSSWGENYILRKADIMGKRYFIRVRYI